VLGLLILLFAAAAWTQTPRLAGKPWARYTIDRSSRGADGVKLIDVNTDGRPDVVTGWEEGGVIRVYFNPSRVDSRSEWRQVTVGKVRSPEDAVFVDLDGDLAFDVVSSCEGNERALFVHWAPKDPDLYWEEQSWKTEVIPASRGLMQWMFAMPMQVDGKHGTDLIAGGKGPNAALGWWEAPERARDLASWRWHSLRPMGWTMSILPADMDGDRDLDILFSDRRGERSGVYWLENPGHGPAESRPWKEHLVGSAGREVMLLDRADVDNDGRMDVLVAVKPSDIHIHYNGSNSGDKWRSESISLPALTGTAKSVRLLDVNQDGKPDVVYSAGQTPAGASGIVWLDLADRSLHDVSGPEGVKYDYLELIDLDGDQDLDVLTTEEAKGLGVVWYENPARR